MGGTEMIREAELMVEKGEALPGPSEITGKHTVPFAALTALFFMWGFITVMNDILIPHLKELFSLSYLQSMLIQFCFFGAYFFGSLVYFCISYFKGDPINKIGYKNGMVSGLLVSSAGCCLFYPAATLSVYSLFLAALFVLGLGFTLLQITANPLVAMLGDERGASSRLNLAQAFNSLGTTIAPVAGGYLIFELFSHQHALAPEATKIPYLCFAVVFILLGVIVRQVKFPQMIADKTEPKGLGALKFPQLRLGIAGIFFYVGAEVAIGSFMISLLGQADVMNLPEAAGKNYLALYWGGAMLGRFLGAISLNHLLSPLRKAMYMSGLAVLVFVLLFALVDLSFPQMQIFLLLIGMNLAGFALGRSLPAFTLIVFALANIFLLLLVIFSGYGYQAMWAVIATGLFNSIMWSNIFTLSIKGLGKHTSQGSSLLVMAILGGAVIPLIQGGFADLWGVRNSFFLPVFSYLYVAFFGFYCLKKNNIRQS